jgi:hypothetical protein
MKTLTLGCALAAFLAATAVQAGGPTPDHPCYDVADCKTQTSQEAFSACIKANKAEADANEDCATFRKDKDAWLEEHGFSELADLFES